MEYDEGEIYDDFDENSGSRSADAKRAAQKTLIACEYCRHRRIRCDGNNPCGSCVQRKRNCIFPKEPPKKRGPKGKPGKDDDYGNEYDMGGYSTGITGAPTENGGGGGGRGGGGERGGGSRSTSVTPSNRKNNTSSNNLTDIREKLSHTKGTRGNRQSNLTMDTSHSLVSSSLITTALSTKSSRKSLSSNSTTPTNNFAVSRGQSSYGNTMMADAVNTAVLLPSSSNNHEPLLASYSAPPKSYATKGVSKILNTGNNNSNNANNSNTMMMNTDHYMDETNNHPNYGNISSSSSYGTQFSSVYNSLPNTMENAHHPYHHHHHHPPQPPPQHHASYTDNHHQQPTLSSPYDNNLYYSSTSNNASGYGVPSSHHPSSRGPSSSSANVSRSSHHNGTNTNPYSFQMDLGMDAHEPFPHHPSSFSQAQPSYSSHYAASSQQHPTNNIHPLSSSSSSSSSLSHGSEVIYPFLSERDQKAIEAYFNTWSPHAPGVTTREEFDRTVSMWMTRKSAAHLVPEVPSHWWTLRGDAENVINDVRNAISSDHEYRDLPCVERAQLAYYYIILACGYRTRGENFTLADTNFYKARNLALSVIDYPCTPLIAALILISYYYMGIGSSGAASIYASFAWRLGRACGLTCDDGKLGSACQFVRQVLCYDLELLPLSPRILPPPSSDTEPLLCPGEVSGGSSTGLSRTLSTGSTTSNAVDTVKNENLTVPNVLSLHRTESYESVSNVTKTGNENVTVRPAGWTYSDGPSISSLSSPSIYPTITSSTTGNATQDHESSSFTNSDNAPCTTCGAVKLLTDPKDITINSHYLMTRSQELLAFILSRMMHIKRNALNRESKRIVWSLVDELVQIYAMAPSYGIEISGGRLATCYGIKGIACRQAGRFDAAVRWCEKAVQVWGNLPPERISQSFVSCFLAHRVALVMLAHELQVASEDIIRSASNDTGDKLTSRDISSSRSHYSAPSVGGITMNHDEKDDATLAHVQVDGIDSRTTRKPSVAPSERFSATVKPETNNPKNSNTYSLTVTTPGSHRNVNESSRRSSHPVNVSSNTLDEDDTKKEFSSLPELPPLSEYPGFYVCANMIKVVAEHWPIAAKMYDTMIAEGKAMLTAAAAKLVQIISSNEHPTDTSTLTSRDTVNGTNLSDPTHEGSKGNGSAPIYQGYPSGVSLSTGNPSRTGQQLPPDPKRPRPNVPLSRSASYAPSSPNSSRITSPSDAPHYLTMVLLSTAEADEERNTYDMSRSEGGTKTSSQTNERVHFSSTTNFRSSRLEGTGKSVDGNSSVGSHSNVDSTGRGLGTTSSGGNGSDLTPNSGGDHDGSLLDVLCSVIKEQSLPDSETSSKGTTGFTTNSTGLTPYETQTHASHTNNHPNSTGNENSSVTTSYSNPLHLVPVEKAAETLAEEDASTGAGHHTSDPALGKLPRNISGTHYRVRHSQSLHLIPTFDGPIPSLDNSFNGNMNGTGNANHGHHLRHSNSGNPYNSAAAQQGNNNNSYYATNQTNSGQGYPNPTTTGPSPYSSQSLSLYDAPSWNTMMDNNNNNHNNYNKRPRTESNTTLNTINNNLNNPPPLLSLRIPSNKNLSKLKDPSSDIDSQVASPIDAGGLTPALGLGPSSSSSSSNNNPHNSTNASSSSSYSLMNVPHFGASHTFGMATPIASNTTSTTTITNNHSVNHNNMIGLGTPLPLSSTTVSSSATLPGSTAVLPSSTSTGNHDLSSSLLSPNPFVTLSSTSSPRKNGHQYQSSTHDRVMYNSNNGINITPHTDNTVNSTGKYYSASNESIMLKNTSSTAGATGPLSMYLHHSTASLTSSNGSTNDTKSMNMTSPSSLSIGIPTLKNSSSSSASVLNDDSNSEFLDPSTPGIGVSAALNNAVSRLNSK